MSTTDRFSPVFDLPRQDIRLDPSRFQGRQGEYSEDTVNAIVSGGRFDPTVSSLVVWKDPDSGQYFLLSGHSRFEAAKRLYESGKQPGLTSLPVKELLNATEEEAVEYATIESNRRGTEEGLVSDLKAYALAVSSGKNSTQLKRLFRPDSRLRKLQELSYLNPKGMFVEYLAQPSQQSFPYLERNARWVGDMRRQLPALTNAHERELFDYLYGSKKALNLDKSKFYDLVNNKVNRIDFDPDKALNLNDRISPTAYTDPINEQLRELDRDIDVAQKEIETRRSAIARARGEGIEVPKYQGRQTFEERIAELNAHIIRLIEKKEALRQASGKLERTMGGDLFSQVEEIPKDNKSLIIAQNNAKHKLGITYWNKFVEEGTIKPESESSIASVMQKFDDGLRPGGRLRADLQSIEDLGPADTRPGYYYVSAIDGGHGTYLILGPFLKHADAIKCAYWAEEMAKNSWKKYNHWMKWGTVRMDTPSSDSLVSPETWKVAHPEMPQPANVVEKSSEFNVGDILRNTEQIRPEIKGEVISVFKHPTQGVFYYSLKGNDEPQPETKLELIMSKKELDEERAISNPKFSEGDHVVVKFGDNPSFTGKIKERKSSDHTWKGITTTTVLYKIVPDDRPDTPGAAMEVDEKHIIELVQHAPETTAYTPGDEVLFDSRDGKTYTVNFRGPTSDGKAVIVGKPADRIDQMEVLFSQLRPKTALVKHDTTSSKHPKVMLVTRQYGTPIYITANPDDKEFGFTGTEDENEAVTWDSTGSNLKELAEVLKRAKYVTGWDGLTFEAAYMHPDHDSHVETTGMLSKVEEPKYTDPYKHALELGKEAFEDGQTVNYHDDLFGENHKVKILYKTGEGDNGTDRYQVQFESGKEASVWSNDLKALESKSSFDPLDDWESNLIRARKTYLANFDDKTRELDRKEVGEDEWRRIWVDLPSLVSHIKGKLANNKSDANPKILHNPNISAETMAKAEKSDVSVSQLNKAQSFLGITFDEYKVLSITVGIKPAFRQKHFQKAGVNDFEQVRQELIHKQYLAPSTAITDLGKDKLAEIKKALGTKRTSIDSSDFKEQAAHFGVTIEPQKHADMIKEGARFEDWSVTKYDKVVFDDFGAPNGGRIKLVNQKTGEDVLIQNDLALRGSEWFLSYGGFTMKDRNVRDLILKFLKVYNERNAEPTAQPEKSDVSVSQLNKANLAAPLPSEKAKVTDPKAGLLTTKAQFDDLYYAFSDFGRTPNDDALSFHAGYRVIQQSDNAFILNEGNDIYYVTLNISGGIDDATVTKNGRKITPNQNLEQAVQNHLQNVNPDSNKRNIDRFLSSQGFYDKTKDGNEFNYMMLSRLKLDCDYFLGAGQRAEKHLHQLSVDAQIAKMKQIWNALPADGKPEWLSMQDILDYETEMKKQPDQMKNNDLDQHNPITADPELVKELRDMADVFHDIDSHDKAKKATQIADFYERSAYFDEDDRQWLLTLSQNFSQNTHYPKIKALFHKWEDASKASNGQSDIVTLPKPSGKQVIADPELLKQLHAYATIANGTGDKKMGAEINEVARFYEKNGYFDEDDRHTLLRYQEFISKGDNKLSSLLSLWQIVPVWGKYDAITKAKAVAHRLNGILPNEYRAEPRGASIIIKKGPAFFAELKLGAIEGEATGYKLNSKMERGDHIDIRVDFPNDSPDYNQQLTRHFMEYGLHQWGMPLNYRSCPPMRDGKPDITPNGLKSLQTCIVDEGDTANRHKDHSGHYTAERMRVHQAIVDEFRNQKPCITAPKKPIAVLTGGAPGSGKSHFLKGFAPWLNGNKVLHIDADEVRAKLPEYKGWNADNTHTETSHIVNMMLDSIGTPCKHDLVYDGTMNKAKKYLPLVDRLKKMGYEVLVIYMQVPKDVSMARVMERYQRTGRYVPQHVIDEVYANGLEAYEEVIKAAHGYIRVDGVTGEILEKGGRPIPTEREYAAVHEPLPIVVHKIADPLLSPETTIYIEQTYENAGSGTKTILIGEPGRPTPFKLKDLLTGSFDPKIYAPKGYKYPRAYKTVYTDVYLEERHKEWLGKDNSRIELFTHFGWAYQYRDVDFFKALKEKELKEPCCEGCAEKGGTPCEDTAKAKKIKLAKAFAFAAKARAKLLQLK